MNKCLTLKNTIFNRKWTFFDLKSINYRFCIVKVLKTINNLFFTPLNRMDRLKHWIGIIFGWYPKKISNKKICNQKKVIVIGSEGQIDALPWIPEGYSWWILWSNPDKKYCIVRLAVCPEKCKEMITLNMIYDTGIIMPAI